jgi:L-lysine exporter family protein LysE/ArgO
VGNIIIHAFLLSFGLIIPLGVQNVFVFQQGAYQTSYWRALPVVITASLCDTLLITLAVTGVSVLVYTVHWLKVLLMIVGVLFLLYMGWSTWNSQPAAANQSTKAFSFKKQIIFAASVSLLNPHAILDTIGVIGTSSLQYAGTEKVIFGLTCISVSWIWFSSLALAGRVFGRIDSTGRLMTLFHKISALIMWLFAFYLIKSI